MPKCRKSSAVWNLLRTYALKDCFRNLQRISCLFTSNKHNPLKNSFILHSAIHSLADVGKLHWSHSCPSADWQDTHSEHHWVLWPPPEDQLGEVSCPRTYLEQTEQEFEPAICQLPLPPELLSLRWKIMANPQGCQRCSFMPETIIKKLLRAASTASIHSSCYLQLYQQLKVISHRPFNSRAAKVFSKLETDRMGGLGLTKTPEVVRSVYVSCRFGVPYCSHSIFSTSSWNLRAISSPSPLGGAGRSMVMWWSYG